MKNLKNNLAIHRASANVAAGTSDINCAALDLQTLHNPECVELVAVFGAISASAVTSIKWQGSKDNSTWVDLADTGQDVADDDDDKIFRNELSPGPDYRYVRAVIERGTANATLRYAIYNIANYRTAGDRDDANVEDHHLTIFPVAGTA